jgi:hypothetical protein
VGHDTVLEDMAALNIYGGPVPGKCTGLLS